MHALLLHRMESEESAQCLLPELPDPCLLAVLQCCAADDLRSLLSAASAHSRLHQAAIAALSSITAVTPLQRHVDGVLLFLAKHSQHLRSVTLRGAGDTRVTIQKLLSLNTQLSSLQLECFNLQPGSYVHSTAGFAAALKRLRLRDCQLLLSLPGLIAVFSAVPAGLEHLSISSSQNLTSPDFQARGILHPIVLWQLQQLTYLEISGVVLHPPIGDQNALHPLQAFTQLIDLRLGISASVTASILSGTHHLTRLQLASCSFEPGALAGKTKLQHLHLQGISARSGDPAAVSAQLLHHLQHLQQLTHLTLQGCLRAVRDGTCPAAEAYSALTAGSKLQHLDLSGCTLPAGVWQHAFPAGRQLPQLHSLNISWLAEPAGSAAPAFEGSLVSCCPGLQSLDLRGLQCSAQLLAPLRGLSRLHTLRLFDDQDCTVAAVVPTVCQLTGLRELDLVCLSIWGEGLLLLQLTQLKQLTALEYTGPLDGYHTSVCLTRKDDEPVWRQVLQRHLNHSDPKVAQQAAAALAE